MFKISNSIKNSNLALSLLIFHIVAIIYFVNVWNFYFIGDDAYISFRYSKHLSEGLGLVWNKAEPVEGYTNFLWVVLMALGMSLKFPPEIFSNVLSTLCGLLTLVGLYRFFLSSEKNRLLFATCLILILSLSRSFTAWSTGGLETMFFSALLFYACILQIQVFEGREKYFYLSAFLFALAGLTRPEGIMFACLAMLVNFYYLISKRIHFRSLVLWSLICFSPIFVHFLWRLSYYGYPFPNTFYAKVAGAWWEQGFNYLKFFHQHYSIVWFLPLILFAFLSEFKFRIGYFFSITLIYLIYILYIGGDRFEFRFLIPILSFFYYLLAEGLYQISQKSKKGLCLAAIIGLALIATTSLALRKETARKKAYSISRISGIAKYGDSRARQGKFIKRMIEKGKLPDDFLIALGGAGAVPYYSELPILDRRGLNDTYIAHLPIENRGVIAHEHDAPLEYLRKRKVIVFDLANKLIHDNLVNFCRKKKLPFHGVELPLRAISLEDKYMVFAIVLEDKEIQKAFKNNIILHPNISREGTYTPCS